MSRISNTHSVSIVANTQLATAAVGMSSGTWLNFGAAYGTTGLTNLVGGPTSGLRTAYATKMAHDPGAKRFYFVGCDHADWDTFLQYDEYANEWTVLTPVVPFGAATNHGYDHNIWVGGSINKYHTRRYGDTLIQRWNGGAGNNWTTIPDPAAVGGGYPSAASGVCWFPDRGPNGAIIVFEQYDGGGSGIVAGIDPVTLTSTTYASGGALANTGPYHNFAHYSPQHQLVWFGGGNGVNTSWTINAAGTVSAPLTSIPSPLITLGPTGDGAPASLPVCNPANGNFIVIAGPNTWYDFNPTSGGTWSVRPGLPQAGVWDTNVAKPESPLWGTIACPLFEPYNVIVFIKGYSVSQPGEMWLYKP